MASTAWIDLALPPLEAARDYLGGQIAWLAVTAIAAHARAADPEVATVLLYWDNEGDPAFMCPGNFYAADGTDLHEADPAGPACPGPRRDLRATRIALDQLTEAIRPYCTRLDETNTGTWQAVTTEFTPGETEVLADGDQRLYVALVLSLDGPPPAGSAAAAPGTPPVIDARNGPRPHHCPGEWRYAGRNGGGHGVFACTGGHSLIAPHPLAAGGHECTSGCPITEIPALPAA